MKRPLRIIGITWDSNQWVSYDDSDTFQQKRAFADSRCLGGLMVWAMDQMDQSESNGFGPAPGVTPSQQADANQGSADLLAQNVCYTSDCGAGCRSGTSEVAQMNGQPGQVSTTERCQEGKYESLCCDDGTTMGTCTWRGFRGVGLSCIGGCADGETEVARNTNHHDKKGDYTCNGGQQSYCCSGFKAASKSQLAQAAEEAAKEAAEAAAEQAALDIAAKAFCRVAVPALLAPLELLEDLVPIAGEIADLAEIAATPALIKLCTDEIEKEGKAEFKVFGKEHTLSYHKPTEKPTETRPPESTHESASEKTSSSCVANEKRAGFRATSTTTTITQSVYPTTVRTCYGDRWPQACLHYRSVINRDPIQYRYLTCTDRVFLHPPRPLVDIYSTQHVGDWITGWMQAPGLNCERDEFPPAAIWQGRNNNQWIRLSPKTQNRGAGSLFKLLCLEIPGTHTTNLVHIGNENNGCRPTDHYRVTQVITHPVLSLDFANMPLYPDDGITQNPCWPSALIDDPGFALLLQDPWYNSHENARLEGLSFYSDPPGIFYTEGKVPRPGYYKRGLTSSNNDVDPDDIMMNEGNSTRKATDEELLAHFGYLRCADEDCSAERAALAIESAIIRGSPKTSVPGVMAVTTAVEVAASPTLTSSPEVRVTSVDLPRMTHIPPPNEDLRREVWKDT
jgi:chitinase